MAKEKVLDLANKISGTKRGEANAITENSPEYLILEPVVTDEMAEVALYLEMGMPQNAAQVAAKCGKPVEEVEAILAHMAVDGSCIAFNVNGVDYYSLVVWVPGIMELMVLNRENIMKYPQMTKAFIDHAKEDAAKFAGNVPPGLGIMRVVPVQRAIEGESRRASYEEVSRYIEDNTIFAVADCQCRVAARQHGQGCGHTTEDICLILGALAEYEIRTGRAKRITKEEAYDVIDKAEKEGLIHQIPNLMGPGKTTTICNCCGCSCLSLINANLYRSPDRIRSNYVSQIDRDKCVACGQCVEYCQVNAITLGQNLCTKIPEAAPEEIITPYDTEWGPDKWNLDYQHRNVVADCGTSPCKTECPAHIAIQGYIKMASMGKYKEALELIKQENPFPAICGRICPKRCESACTRADLDDPIAIDEIKKFIAEQDLKAEHRYIPEKKPTRPEKIAIIGSGPAGLSCAYFLAVEGYQVTVFEKEKVLGGMLTLGIPSFRLERDIINSEIEILRELGVKFKTDVEIGKHMTTHELKKLGYKAIYLAIGAQASKELGLGGESAEGVLSGINFLRKVNLGEDVKMDGQTIVIGGGNVAIDVARTAVRLGAVSTEMYCLETRAEMPALNEELEEAEVEGIIINNSWGPVRILEENGHVTGVELKKCISAFDKEGRFSPVFDESVTKIVKADNVLISIGQDMAWTNLLNGSKLEINPNRTIIVNEFSYQTNDPDIFAGGDVVTGPKFAIDAIAMGKQGAISIHRYVHGDNLILSRERDYHALNKEILDLEGYDRMPRQKPLHVDASKSKATFKDLRTVLTEEQIKQETNRCLGCGAAVVDQYLCVGCGICTTKCRFDSISLVRKYDHSSVETPEIKPTIMKYMMERHQRIAEKKAGK